MPADSATRSTPATDPTTLAASFLAGTLPPQLKALQARIRALVPDVKRVGAFLTDTTQTTLSHWADSEGQTLPCPQSLAALADNPLLSRCADTGEARAAFVQVDPALEWAADGRTCPLIALPLGPGNARQGFLVVETAPGVLLPAQQIHQLLAWTPLAVDLLVQGIDTVRALVGTTRFALDFTLMRDRDTGEHQLRLRDYVQLLSRELARVHGLDDSFVAELALFGPLHDIGKVGIPDAILLKPGQFEPREWETMKEHVVLGRGMIERMIDDFQLHDTPGMHTLQAVVAHHHECLDGSGYPEGLQGDEIPLAARIVSTADIFDALTCPRPYKRSWSIDEAFEQLRTLAGHKLDRECVSALQAARPQIEEVWQRHAAMH
ncbi:HD-GYP domain-containing protein [Pseudothauera nasutitermitis]|uniref:HD-GYP domain-containing protein n=1 Tax=Pseudothauera nasutitermitis TaxID=2565930 RepID=A0A4V3WCB8_9RHOO|nr:HD-GYP domain-containing protein [Pseudothauera nasutitermitis]THF66558.1 HD-GYP domain-containing protein [Pseudothauera nasutitermitis]